MALNDDGLALAANALVASLAYAQLHSAAAGTSGTDNAYALERQPVTWNIPTTGDLSLASGIRFTGGTPNGTVYSVTLWDADADGTFYGEYPLSGDLTFNGQGEFLVTAIDFTATSSDV